MSKFTLGENTYTLNEEELRWEGDGDLVEVLDAWTDERLATYSPAQGDPTFVLFEHVVQQLGEENLTAIKRPAPDEPKNKSRAPDNIRF